MPKEKTNASQDRIWEIRTMVERFNREDEPQLWRECMHLLSKSSKNSFLNETISNIPEVNDGFSEAKAWLITKGLSEINGTLLYALQLTAYSILLKAKDKENKPLALTDEWLKEIKDDLKKAYLNFRPRDKNLIDHLGAGILMIGRIPYIRGTLEVSIFLMFLMRAALLYQKRNLSRKEEDPLLSIQIYYASVLTMVLALVRTPVLRVLHPFFARRERQREFKENSYLPEVEADEHEFDKKIR